MTGTNMTGGRKRISIADDTASSREILRSILETCDYEVEEAADDEQAVECAGGSKPDLVILDLHLPRMDGYATVVAMRRIPGLHRTPIIPLTAAVTRTVPEQLAEAGFTAFLVKPLGPTRLRKCVASLL